MVIMAQLEKQHQCCGEHDPKGKIAGAIECQRNYARQNQFRLARRNARYWRLANVLPAQGMERKSQNRPTRAPEPSKRYGCNAGGHGTRRDCPHTRKPRREPRREPPRKPPREIDQDRVGMNTVTPPRH